jgi:hypothetical protein
MYAVSLQGEKIFKDAVIENPVTSPFYDFLSRYMCFLIVKFPL